MIFMSLQPLGCFGGDVSICLKRGRAYYALQIEQQQGSPVLYIIDRKGRRRLAAISSALFDETAMSKRIVDETDRIGLIAALTDAILDGHFDVRPSWTPIPSDIYMAMIEVERPKSRRQRA